MRLGAAHPVRSWAEAFTNDQRSPAHVPGSSDTVVTRGRETGRARPTLCVVIGVADVR